MRSLDSTGEGDPTTRLRDPPAFIVVKAKGGVWIANDGPECQRHRRGRSQGHDWHCQSEDRNRQRMHVGHIGQRERREHGHRKLKTKPRWRETALQRGLFQVFTKLALYNLSDNTT